MCIKISFGQKGMNSAGNIMVQVYRNDAGGRRGSRGMKRQERWINSSFTS